MNRTLSRSDRTVVSSALPDYAVASPPNSRHNPGHYLVAVSKSARMGVARVIRGSRRRSGCQEGSDGFVGGEVVGADGDVDRRIVAAYGVGEVRESIGDSGDVA